MTKTATKTKNESRQEKLMRSREEAAYRVTQKSDWEILQEYRTQQINKLTDLCYMADNDFPCLTNDEVKAHRRLLKEYRKQLERKVEKLDKIKNDGSGTQRFACIYSGMATLLQGQEGASHEADFLRERIKELEAIKTEKTNRCIQLERELYEHTVHEAARSVLDQESQRALCKAIDTIRIVSNKLNQ